MDSQYYYETTLLPSKYEIAIHCNIDKPLAVNLLGTVSPIASNKNKWRQELSMYQLTIKI